MNGAELEKPGSECTNNVQRLKMLKSRWLEGLRMVGGHIMFWLHHNVYVSTRHDSPFMHCRFSAPRFFFLLRREEAVNERTGFQTPVGERTWWL